MNHQRQNILRSKTKDPFSKQTATADSWLLMHLRNNLLTLSHNSLAEEDDQLTYIPIMPQTSCNWQREIADDQDEQLHQFYHENKILWHSVVPNASKLRGSWESHVKILKLHLWSLNNYSLVQNEEFNTFLIMIEGIKNSRPNMELYVVPDEFSPLTPSHFLIGTSVSGTPT